MIGKNLGEEGKEKKSISAQGLNTIERVEITVLPIINP